MPEMPVFESCESCGAPLLFVNNHQWLDGGVIVQSQDPDHRMILMEVENLDLLFKGIEGLIGLPIERIITETKRRATRDYIERLISSEVKEGVRRKEIPVEPLIHANNALSIVMGYGKPVLEGYRLEYDEDDHLTQLVSNPYSIPLWCGDMTGAVEAVTSRDNDVEYQSLSGNMVRIKVYPSTHPPQFKERLKIRKYFYRMTGYTLTACSVCNGPVELSRFSWNMEEGIIIDPHTGRRLCIIGPAYLEAIFDEIERELGEDIPRTVMEAQRLYVKERGFYDPGEIATLEGFRKLFATRGLGYLDEFHVEKDGLFLRLVNPVLHLLMVGLFQGYYEMKTGTPLSTAQWLLEGPVLQIEIKGA